MDKKTTNMKEGDVRREAVKDYFTKDFLDRVNGMSSDEMIQSLKELEGTVYWVAIVKYSYDRLTNAQQALITLDPFKQPTEMARYQGIMSGLSDLQEAVISLKKKAEEALRPEVKAEEAKNELGGAYGVI